MDLFTLLFLFALLMVMSGICIRALASPEPMNGKERLALIASAVIPSSGTAISLFYSLSNRFPGVDNLSPMLVVFGIFFSGILSYFSFMMLREKGSTTAKMVQIFGGIYFFVTGFAQLVWFISFLSDLFARTQRIGS